MPSAPVVAGAPAPLTVTPAAGPLLQLVTNVSWSVTHLCSSHGDRERIAGLHAGRGAELELGRVRVRERVRGEVEEDLVAVVDLELVGADRWPPRGWPSSTKSSSPELAVAPPIAQMPSPKPNWSVSPSGATGLVVRPAVASRLSAFGFSYVNSAPEPPGGPKQSASARVGTVTPSSTM